METEENVLSDKQGFSPLTQDWASFCGRFKEQAASKTVSATHYEINRSMLLCAGGALSITVINNAESYGLDPATLENLLELVEETCLLNLLLVFEKYRCYVDKSKSDVVEAFGKAWSVLSETTPSDVSDETLALIKTEDGVSAQNEFSVVCEVELRESQTNQDVSRPVDIGRIDLDNSEKDIDKRKDSSDAHVQFHCHICYQPFSRLRTLQVHKKKKHRLEAVADYCCQLCGNEFYLLSTLKSHIHRKHFEQRHSLCLFCGKYFEDPIDCRRHRLKHMVENRQTRNSKKKKGSGKSENKGSKVEIFQQPFQCQVCLWKFSMLESLQNHIFRKHNDKKDLICRYCGQCFKTATDCRKHVQDHLVERKRRPEYKCGLCPASFQLREGLQGHVSAVHAAEQGNMCGYCGKLFETLEDCCEHMRQKLDLPHGDSDNEGESKGRDAKDIEPVEDDVDLSETAKTDPQEFHCELCDTKFETVMRLQNHIFRRHHDEKNLICRYCGKKFSEPEECSEHVRAHIAENRKLRKFRQQTSTARPLQGNYRCQLCKKTFQLDSALRSHRLREHYADKDRLCPSCGKVFKTAEDCTKHRRLHFERRMFGSKANSGAVIPGFTNCLCQICGKEFKLLSSLESHLKRKHPTNRYYLCKYCGKHFTTAQERKAHVRMHTIKKREFSNTALLNHHVADTQLSTQSKDTSLPNVTSDKNPDLKLVKCFVCGLEYQLVASLRRHIHRKHKDVKDRLCHHCGLQFDDAASCKLHLQTEHHSHMRNHTEILVSDPLTMDTQLVQVKEENSNLDLEQNLTVAISGDPKTEATIVPSPKPWKCGLCSSLFSSRRNMRDHIRILHSKEKEQMCYCCGQYFSDPAECQKHKQEDLACEYCPKAFKTKLSKDNHMRKHVDQRNFQCHICGSFYFDKRGLNAHYQRHSNAMKQSHQCLECGKILSSKETLKYHMRLHRNERPFACDICGKAFTQKVTWQNHQEIHAGIKPFECEVCGKKTRTRADMARHMPLHSDKKDFVCDVCGKAYRFPSGLQQHKSLHTGHRPHICKICGCTYRHSSELKKHMRTHRPGAKTRGTTVPRVHVPGMDNTSNSATNSNSNTNSNMTIQNDTNSVSTNTIIHNISNNVTVAPPVDTAMTVIIPQDDGHSHPRNISLSILPEAATVNNTYPHHHNHQAVTSTYQTMTTVPSTGDNSHTNLTAMLERGVTNSYLDTADVVSRVGANNYTNDEMAVVVALQVLDEMVVVDQNV